MLRDASSPAGRASRAARLRALLLAAIPAALLLGACADEVSSRAVASPTRPAPGAVAEDGDDAAAVAAVLAELMAADNDGDLARVAACYAPDAVLMPPDGPVVEGRDAILDRYDAGFARFRMEVSSTSAETRVSGDLAFDRGVTRGWFHWHDGRPASRLSDKYLMLLTRGDDGGWRISHLIWSRLPEEF